MKRTAIVVMLLIAAASAYADTGSRIAQSLRDKGLSPEAIVFVISMLPIVELRGAIPVGEVVLGLPLWKTLLLSIAGNFLPMILVVLLLNRVVVWLGRIPLFKRFFDWVFWHSRRRGGIIARYEFWGLVVFVGIPLPITGAWTGSVAAVLMGMPYWRSLLAILLGILTAAVIVTMLSLLRVWGVVIAAAALAVLIAQAAIAAMRRRRPAV